MRTDRASLLERGPHDGYSLINVPVESQDVPKGIREVSEQFLTARREPASPPSSMRLAGVTALARPCTGKPYLLSYLHTPLAFLGMNVVASIPNRTRHQVLGVGSPLSVSERGPGGEVTMLTVLASEDALPKCAPPGYPPRPTHGLPLSRSVGEGLGVRALWSPLSTSEPGPEGFREGVPRTGWRGMRLPRVPDPAMVTLIRPAQVYARAGHTSGGARGCGVRGRCCCRAPRFSSGILCGLDRGPMNDSC